MSSQELITFTLTPDNPSNTTITSPIGEVVYSVVTEYTKKATITQVRNAQEDIVASSEWRDVLPDKITFGSQKPVSLAEWMKRSIIPFKDDISFTDNQGRKYKWKRSTCSRHFGKFEVYTADDNYSVPIARFNPSRRTHAPVTSVSNRNPASSTTSLSPTLVDAEPSWTPATLDLTLRAIEIQDLIVSSFLFLECRRFWSSVSDETRTEREL